MSYRSRKLLDAANGKPCVLCGHSGTTVACHIRSVALGSGTGCKAPDCLTAWLCQTCHDHVDDRNKSWTEAERKERWYFAFAKTMVQLFEQGIVVVK